MPMWRILLTILSALWVFGVANQACAEDGYKLWLRYQPVDSVEKARVEPLVTHYVGPSRNPTIDAAMDEFARGLNGMIGHAPVRRETVMGDGAVLITTAASPLLKGLDLPFGKLGKEGFLIRSATL